MSTEMLTHRDERIKSESFATKLMKRPELGAIGGVVLVTLFFLATADRTMFTLSGIMNFMTPAAQLGILGIAAAMLMIGGEFDLSIGSMVAFAGMLFGAFTVNVGMPLILAIPLTLLLAAALGAGASGFLLKDAGRQQIAEGIRVVAAGEALLAPTVTRRLLERFADRLAGDRLVDPRRR